MKIKMIIKKEKIIQLAKKVINVLDNSTSPRKNIHKNKAIEAEK